VTLRPRSRRTIGLRPTARPRRPTDANSAVVARPISCEPRDGRCEPRAPTDDPESGGAGPALLNHLAARSWSPAGGLEPASHALIGRQDHAAPSTPSGRIRCGVSISDAMVRGRPDDRQVG